MRISCRTIHRVLAGMLLAGTIVTAAADQSPQIVSKEWLEQLYGFSNKSLNPNNIAVVIAIDFDGKQYYFVPPQVKVKSGKLLPYDVGTLTSLDSLAIASTSKSPNCIWIKMLGGLYYFCPP